MILFVLEIGGFLAFAGGVLYLLVSGRLRDMFRDREPKPLLLIALVSVVALYHWTSLIRDLMTTPETAVPESHSVVPPDPPPLDQDPALEAAPVPEPSPIMRRARAAAPAYSRTPPARPAADVPPAQPQAPHWKTIVVDDELANQRPAAVAPKPAAPEPAAAAPLPTDADPYQSKSKRAIKAVGHFLRYRKDP